MKTKTVTRTIAPQSGAAFAMKKGQFLKIIDPEGQQVSDLLLFSADDIREKLSSGKTLDYEETIYLKEENYLWSNRSQKMAKIVADTNGCNDFLLAPCSPETFQIIYNDHSEHPSCFNNLAVHLKPYGVQPDDIPSAFNVFMNVPVGPDGNIKVLPPTTKAGDYMVLEILMDVIVGMTACSAEQSNNYSFKPVHYQVLDDYE